MELYDEQVSEQKKSKLPLVIGILIGILLLITIALIFGIIYLKGSITQITIDGQAISDLEKMIYIEQDETSSKIYMPIIKISSFFGYEGFTGDYLNKSEDKTKCHVASENETAMFTLDSNILVKIAKGSELEYLQLDEPVIEKNGELCTTVEGIEKAFNILFSSDEKLQKIEMYTMDYLITHYATSLKLENYTATFSDKKAIFEDMLIIQDGNQYGVIQATTGKAVLETKYEAISYLPSTKDFIVKSNGRYGIVTKDATVKVRTVYDSINIMDNRNGLYLVKQNGVFGVVDAEGKTVIEPEYNQIGINIAKYARNGVENSFVLLNQIIPIKNNQNLWALFNIKGERITEFKYTEIGCTISSVKNSYPALVVPSYNLVVVQSGEFYNLVTLEGKELAPENRLNEVYLKVNSSTEQNQYFMLFNNNEKVINIEEWLASVEE